MTERIKHADPNRVYRVTYPCPRHGSHRWLGSFVDCIAFVHILMVYYECPSVQLDDNTSAVVDELDDCDELVDSLAFDGRKESVDALIQRFKRGN